MPTKKCNARNPASLGTLQAWDHETNNMKRLTAIKFLDRASSIGDGVFPELNGEYSHSVDFARTLTLKDKPCDPINKTNNNSLCIDDNVYTANISATPEGMQYLNASGNYEEFLQWAGPLHPMRAIRGWRTSTQISKSLCMSSNDDVPANLDDWDQQTHVPAWLVQNWSPPILDDYVVSQPYDVAKRIMCETSARSGPECTDFVQRTHDQTCSGYGWIGNLNEARYIPRDSTSDISDIARYVYDADDGMCVCPAFQLDAKTMLFPNAFVSWADPRVIELVKPPQNGYILPSLMDPANCATWAAGLPTPPVDLCSSINSTSTTVNNIKSVESIDILPAWVRSDEKDWSKAYASSASQPDVIKMMQKLTSNSNAPLLGIASSIVWDRTNLTSEMMLCMDSTNANITLPSSQMGLGVHNMSSTQSKKWPIVWSFQDDFAMVFMDDDSYKNSATGWRMPLLESANLGNVTSKNTCVNYIHQVLPPVWVSRRAYQPQTVYALASSTGPVRVNQDANGTEKWQCWKAVRGKSACAAVQRFGISDCGRIWVQLPNVTYNSESYDQNTGDQVIPVRPAVHAPEGGDVRLICPCPLFDDSAWTDDQEQEERPRLSTWTCYAEDPRYASWQPNSATVCSTSTTNLPNNSPCELDVNSNQQSASNVLCWEQPMQLLSMMRLDAQTSNHTGMINDPWACAFSNNLSRPVHQRYVSSPRFRWVLGPLESLPQGNAEINNYTRYRVHDEIIVAPDRMKSLDLDTVTFLMDSGLVIVAALGVSTTQYAATRNAILQMTNFKEKLNDAFGYLGDLWPLPLDEDDVCPQPTIAQRGWDEQG
jgi:hypothetical protein